MKRQILTFVTVLALLATGAVFAQSTLNTPAPGPSQETKPGQTNNNLQNPGNPQMQRPDPQNPPVRENGTVEGTAAESNARTDQTGTTTSTTTQVDNTTETTGTMNNMDQTTAPPTTTTTTEPTTTGTYNGTTDTSTTTGGSLDNTGTATDTSATSETLPQTASDLPTLALMGLLALSAAFAVRAYAKRNA